MVGGISEGWKNERVRKYERGGDMRGVGLCEEADTWKQVALLEGEETWKGTEI